MRDLRQYVQLHRLPAELEAKMVRSLEFHQSWMTTDPADLQLSRSLEVKVAWDRYSALLAKCRAKGQLFFGKFVPSRSHSP